MSDHKIHKPKPVSGFPEWLPEYRAVELTWMDKIRAVFESYGFCSIETPSIEEIDALTAKGGETEKEIYTLTRLHAEPEQDKEARLALHFDLTVPMARYVAQHFGDLVFPFKRYQIQKSWRGERPQKGRYREFYQCDIDVVNIDTLPLHFDAELPAVLYQAYQALDIPPVEMHISNRKIIVGYLQGLGIGQEKIPEVTRILDKSDKIGKTGVAKLLYSILYSIGGNIPEVTEENWAALEKLERERNKNDPELASNQYPASIGACLDFIRIKTHDNSFANQLEALIVQNPSFQSNELFAEGVQELSFVMQNLSHLPPQSVIANLGIIRGLDYYTGTVLEVKFQDKDFSTMAIGGGGRYEDLAGSFINQKLPGIGVSIGLTRLFGLLIDKGLIKPGAKSPAQILVVLPDEARRTEATAIAHTLRARGYNVEMYHRDAKVKNQIAYAEKKGIPYVWFPPFEDGQVQEVKNMSSGEQKPADPKTWTA